MDGLSPFSLKFRGGWATRDRFEISLVFYLVGRRDLADIEETGASVSFIISHHLLQGFFHPTSIVNLLFRPFKWFHPFGFLF